MPQPTWIQLGVAFSVLFSGMALWHRFPKAVAAALAVVAQHDVPLVQAQKAAKPGAAVPDCRALDANPPLA